MSGKVSQQNCNRISEQFWLTNPIDLLMNYTLLPNQSMTLGAKLNSVYRLTILFFIVFLLVFGFHTSIMFLVIATIMNIVFYPLYKNKYL